MRRGQALVLVLMVLSVALTVGLAVVSRSVTEMNVTTAQEESAKALEAAEAGLEKALGGTLSGNSGSLTGSSATFVVLPTPTPVRKSDYVVQYPLPEGNAATVDMTNYVRPSDATEHSQIRFCWGNNMAGSGPALEATLYYEQAGVTRLGRVVLDPAGRISSSFGSPWTTGGCPAGVGFKYSKKLSFGDFDNNAFPISDTTVLKMIRMKLLFVRNSKAEPVAVVSNGGDFGQQGEEFTAVGSSGTSTQKIRGVNLNYDIPAVFDNAVFSGASLIKI